MFQSGQRFGSVGAVVCLGIACIAACDSPMRSSRSQAPLTVEISERVEIGTAVVNDRWGTPIRFRDDGLLIGRPGSADIEMWRDGDGTDFSFGGALAGPPASGFPTDFAVAGPFIVGSYSGPAVDERFLRFFGRDVGGVNQWGVIGEIPGPGLGDFGRSLAMNPDILAVGAPGSNRVFFFRRAATSDQLWNPEGEVAGGPNFGRQIVFSNGDLLISDDLGVHRFVSNGLNIPPYVFEDTTQRPGASPMFGAVMSADDEDNVAISDPMTRIVTIFENDDGLSFTQEVLAADGFPDMRFGESVAIRKNHLAVGSPDGGGRVFQYSRYNEDQGFEFTNIIERPMGVEYGSTVSMGEHLLAIGDPEFGGGAGLVEAMILNGNPNAMNDFYPVQTAAELLPVLENDLDPDDEPSELEITIDSPPSVGTVDVVNGEIRYTPNDAGVPDSFTYTITDELGLSDSAFVSIGIEMDMVEDIIDVDEMVDSIFPIIDNDVFPDGTTFTVEPLEPEWGQIGLNAENEVVLRPAGQIGEAKFVYTGQFENVYDSAVVTLNIGANDPPVFENPMQATTLETAVGTPFVVEFSAFDPEGVAVRYAFEGPGDALGDETTGQWEWTPRAENVGVHQVIATAFDDYHQTFSATVRLIVSNQECDVVNCGPEETCMNGVCFAECTDTTDCETGRECFNGACKLDACESVVCSENELCYAGSCYGQCVDNGDCADAQSCFDGRCAADACDDVICAAGQVCFSGSCFAECAENGECANGLQCFEQRCARSSCDDIVCATGEACFDGNCFPGCIEGDTCSNGGTCTDGVCQPPQDKGCCATTAPSHHGRLLVLWLLFATMILRKRTKRCPKQPAACL